MLIALPAGTTYSPRRHGTVTRRPMIGITGRERMPSMIVASTCSAAPRVGAHRFAAGSRVRRACGRAAPRSRRAELAVVSCPASTSVISSSRSSRRSAAGHPRSVAPSSSERMSRRSSRSSACRRLLIRAYTHRSGTSEPEPGEAERLFVSDVHQLARAWRRACVEARSSCSDREAQARARAVPEARASLDAEDSGHDHVEGDRLHPWRERKGTADRPAVDLTLGGVGDHLPITRDRVSVEGRQQ